ncbi:MAG TPA: rod shape-determining protein MreC [bacterium]|nr:rod shape-determining protein MreC [bacterium]
MRRWMKIFAWAMLTIFVILFLLVVFNRSYLLFDKIVYPVQGFLYNRSQGIRDLYDNWKNFRELEKENKLLMEKNIQLELANSQLLSAKQENDELRTQLNYVTENAYSVLGAEVIGKSTSPYEQVLIINKGTIHGVKPGYPAVVGEGYLIGKIIVAHKTYSLLQLLIDNNSAVAATVQNIDKTSGVVNGEYGLSLRMNFIPQNENVVVGDKVISSGLEKYIPRGLLIGVVEELKSEQGELFKTADIKTMVDFNKITSLLILKSND